MVIIFPKKSFYTSKSLEGQRIARDRVKKYLDLFCQNDIQFTRLLEDELASDFFNEYSIPAKVITAIQKSDYVFMTQYPDRFDISQDVLAQYNNTELFEYSVEDQFKVDDNLMFKDLEGYLTKSTDAVRKRHRLVVSKLLERNPSACVFDGNVQTNMCTLPSSIATVGDGKLYIEVELQSNQTRIYFGGVYIPEDEIGNILKVFRR